MPHRRELVQSILSITGGHLDLAPRFNIAPTQQVPVVRSAGGENNLAMMRWGLVPFWAKERNTRYAMINARDDKILETRSYVGPFKSRRCLIPATGYFEWQKGPGKSKQPMLIRLKTGEPFAFAGIWELWHDRADPGAPEQRSADLINCVLSCSIITTNPNALMEPIHDRMPVILSPDLYRDWMDPANQDVGGLKEMLLPYAPGLMEAFPVSPWVNSARNEGPDLVQPAQQPEFSRAPAWTRHPSFRPPPESSGGGPALAGVSRPFAPCRVSLSPPEESEDSHFPVQP